MGTIAIVLTDQRFTEPMLVAFPHEYRMLRVSLDDLERDAVHAVRMRVATDPQSPDRAVARARLLTPDLDPASLSDEELSVYTCLLARLAGVEPPGLADALDAYRRTVGLTTACERCQEFTSDNLDELRAHLAIAGDADDAADDADAAGDTSEPEAETDDTPEPEISGEPEAPAQAQATRTPRAHTFTASSNVASFEHDEDAGDLVVTFRSGKNYRYGRVTRAQVDEWIKFPSPGQWLVNNLKAHPTRHPCRAVSAGADE